MEDNLVANKQSSSIFRRKIAAELKSVFQKKERSTENEQILSEIERTKLEMTTAYSNFNNVTEAELIDFYAYQLKAAQAKYAHLLKAARERGLFATEGQTRLHETSWRTIQ